MQYQSPINQELFVEIKRVDLSPVFSMLAKVKPPEVFKQMVKAYEGGMVEVENPDHPESKKRQAEHKQEIEQIIASYLIEFAIVINWKAVQGLCDNAIKKWGKVLGHDAVIGIDRRDFFLEYVFTENQEQLGDLITALLSLNVFQTVPAVQLARMFRSNEKWIKYIRP